MDDLTSLLVGVNGFEWDAGNTSKNVFGHGVSRAEAEEIFFHMPVLLYNDIEHSAGEVRFVIHGSTSAGRLLTAAFTIRGDRVRIISVRDMSRRERRTYEKTR